MSEPWYTPENLARLAHAADRAATEGGDFGSYAAALRKGTIEGTEVDSHNLVAAAARVRQYRHILPRRRYASIADVGSGLGFTTLALAREFAAAKVVGYEVSPDAVAYAERHHPGPTYRCQVIDITSELGERFDLVLAQEFYPFTRTAEWKFAKSFIDLLLRHLNPGGILLIELSERHPDRTILANRAELAAFRPRYRRLAFDRIYRKLKSFWLSDLASAVVGPLRGADRNLAILIADPRKPA
jgi:SAM-dependent methyltransferase